MNLEENKNKRKKFKLEPYEILINENKMMKKRNKKGNLFNKNTWASSINKTETTDAKKILFNNIYEYLLNYKNQNLDDEEYKFMKIKDVKIDISKEEIYGYIDYGYYGNYKELVDKNKNYKPVFIQEPHHIDVSLNLYYITLINNSLYIVLGRYKHNYRFKSYFSDLIKKGVEKKFSISFKKIMSNKIINRIKEEGFSIIELNEIYKDTSNAHIDYIPPVNVNKVIKRSYISFKRKKNTMDNIKLFLKRVIGNIKNTQSNYFRIKSNKYNRIIIHLKNGERIIFQPGKVLCEEYKIINNITFVHNNIQDYEKLVNSCRDYIYYIINNNDSEYDFSELMDVQTIYDY